MDKIGLIGGGFQHAFSSTLWKKPSKFSWSKNKIEDITFFVDMSIEYGLNIKCKRKFAWLLESRIMTPQVVQFVKENYKTISSEYEILFTHNKEIYELADNFIYLPPHGFWIEDPKIHPKSKLVSMISSNKNYTHRLNWVNKFKNNVDLYGRGFNELNKKEDGLKDYMFSITVENDSYPTYWSEKILDCFATGTIPIYYGSPDIGDYFNMDGIILMTDDFDITKINEDEYYKRMVSIEDNFNKSLQYNVIEDIIYEKWIK